MKKRKLDTIFLQCFIINSDKQAERRELDVIKKVRNISKQNSGILSVVEAEKLNLFKRTLQKAFE
ncbi:hypothetical protein ACS7YX_000177 [Enterococcus hirae]